MSPPIKELERQAAHGDVLYNDDTSMKILDLPFWEPEKSEKKRTGIHTTCVVSTVDDRKIALFFTGRKHAGENLADLISKRSEDLETPIQMCDALSRNTKGDFETIVANCLAHGRRKFTDVAVNFPKGLSFCLGRVGICLWQRCSGTRRKFIAQRTPFAASREEQTGDG